MRIKAVLLSTLALFFAALYLNGQSAEWKVTTEALDLRGNPIYDVRVGITYFTPRGPRVDAYVTAQTDRDGRATVSQRSPNYIGISFGKDGYYVSRLQYTFDTSRLRRWYPWDPTITMVMRDIRNPIRMHWKRQTGFMPDGERAAGYDFEVGDWVAPHGRGKTADVIFSSESWAESIVHYDGTLTLSFPNEGDGIQEFRVDTDYHPGLLSDYEAPEDGYQSVLLHRSRSNVKLEGEDIAPLVGHDPDQHFYLRTRTVLDANGNVVSAHYSKWKGGIEYTPTSAHLHIYEQYNFKPENATGPRLNFTYFFNPTANDRNMEHARSNNPPLPGSEFDSPNYSFGTNGQRSRGKYTPGSTPDNQPALAQ